MRKHNVTAAKEPLGDMFGGRKTSMQVMQILNVKKFMNLLLRETAFDQYKLRSLQIQSIALFTIEGTFCQEGKKELLFCQWKEVKPIVYDIIKGRPQPKSFKLVLSVEEEEMEAWLPGAAALFLNFQFEQEQLNCVTGFSMKNFTMDKTMELAWDAKAQQLLQQMGLVCTCL